MSIKSSLNRLTSHFQIAPISPVNKIDNEGRGIVGFSFGDYLGKKIEIDQQENERKSLSEYQKNNTESQPEYYQEKAEQIIEMVQ